MEWFEAKQARQRELLEEVRRQMCSLGDTAQASACWKMFMTELWKDVHGILTLSGDADN